MLRTMFDISETEKRELFTDLVKNWDSISTQGFANKWNVSRILILGIATRLRKRGINLTHKGRNSFLTPEFIAELKSLQK